jgi:regulator of sigma E protease
MGHFITAKKSGVLVEEFAVGMGPKILSKQYGETLYSLRAFPIGGFCKMLGEDDQSTDNRAICKKSIAQRFLILSGGAIMNLILAFLIFLFLVAFNGFTSTKIHSVVDGSPAQQLGLQPGDKIIRLNGSIINIYDDLTYEISLNNGTSMPISYERNGKRHNSEITPYKYEDGSYKVGIMFEGRTGIFEKSVEGIQRAGIFESLGNAACEIVFYVKATVGGIIRLITLQLPMEQMSGPIGIVTVIGQAYDASIQNGVWIMVMQMLYLCAILSANLGVFNLLPLPGLDGGRLVFVLFEAIRKKPLPAEKEGLVHFIGLVLLMILAVFIAYSDIRKLFI